MNFYGRRSHGRNTGPTAADDDHRRRERRRQALLAAGIMRAASAAIRAGTYRSGPTRPAPIPRTSGGTRTLRIANLADRVVGAALADVLTPTFEAIFHPNSYGFRPKRGTWNLLVDLEATLAAHPRLTTLAIDDVRQAFDHVPIAPLLETFAESITDTKLMDLIEVVLRGGTNRNRTLGIPQGCPLSPLVLNVILHKHHDVPLAGDVTQPLWWRYADNLAYLCPSVSEGNSILDRIRGQLEPLGLTLKGADGPAVDLRTDEAQLLSFRVRIRGDHLQLRLGEHVRTKLTQRMAEAHEEPEPPQAARAAVLWWIAAMGPAFATRPEITRTVGTIIRAGATWGFRELGFAATLHERCAQAHQRWLAYREVAVGRGRSPRGPTTGAAPPATSPPVGSD